MAKKRFPIWRMELLHLAMWHDHDWFRQVTAPCNAACGSGIMTVNSPAAPCSVIGGSAMTCRWIRPVAAPCNVAGARSAMTCHGIRANVRHIGHLVSILTTSPQSTFHSASVCEILFKLDHPQQKKMASCRFSTWRISPILDFRRPIMGSLKSPCTTSYR